MADAASEPLELSEDLRSLLAALAHAPAWPSEETPRIAPGDKIGRYTLEGVIGRGGFGVVFAAHDEDLGRKVAVKVTRGEPTPEVLARFQREARMAARINHPNLVTLHDSGTIAGLPYLVLELLDGETLAARLARGPLPMDTALAIAIDVLRAIAIVHDAGIVHLDIKPSNVFLTKDDRVKVLDFGLAELRARPSDAPLGGTPAYMAPEQWRGVKNDARSDVFSIGVMIFAMTTGALPFASEAKERSGPDLQRAPARLRPILARALATEPADRFASAREMLDAVTRVARPRSRAKAAAWALGAMGMLALVALGGWQWKARRAAVEAARVAQRAGHEAAAIEAELRFARLEPLHDTRAEEARARSDLEALAREVEAAGDVGEGATYVELARAERALGDVDRARARLERVIAQGGRTQAAVAALGNVLLDQFEAETFDAQHDLDPERRARRKADLQRTLRDPALAYLHEAADATPLALARVALYEERYDDARAAARDALRAAPGEYEASTLIGDAFSAEAFAASTRGDLAGVLASSKLARDAYGEAVAIARSDARIYRRICRAWDDEFRALRARGEDASEQYREGSAACERALTAAPGDPMALTEAAVAAQARAQELVQKGKDPRPLLTAAIDRVTAARATLPNRADLARAAGILFAAKAFVEANRGVNPDASYEAATSAYEDAARLAPEGSARETLGILLVQRAQFQLEHGADPTAASERALELLSRRETPDELVAAGSALTARATWEAKHGKDPTASLAAAIDAFEKARAKRPTDAHAADEEGGAWQAKAEWERRSGDDERPSLDHAILCTEAVLAVDHDDLTGLANLGEELTLRAEAELDRARDPRAFLDRAIASLEKASAIDPENAAPLTDLAVAREVEARMALAAKTDPARSLDAARAALQKAGSKDDDDPARFSVACAIERDAAAQAIAKNASPTAAFAKARAACDKALAADGDDAAALERAAELLLDEARWKRAHQADASRDVEEGLRRVRACLAAAPKFPGARETEGALVALAAP